jgi:hypothetical protein
MPACNLAYFVTRCFDVCGSVCAQQASPAADHGGIAALTTISSAAEAATLVLSWCMLLFLSSWRHGLFCASNQTTAQDVELSPGYRPNKGHVHCPAPTLLGDPFT